MRRLCRETSSNPRSSHHGVEKETQYDWSHTAKNRSRRKNNVQTKPYTQTPVCFNLAFLINFAEPALIRANPRITTQRHSKEFVITIARQVRRQRLK